MLARLFAPLALAAALLLTTQIDLATHAADQSTTTTKSATKQGKSKSKSAVEKPAWPAWLAEHGPTAVDYLNNLKSTAENSDDATIASRRVTVRESLASGALYDARATLERVIADRPDDYAGWALLGLTSSYKSDEEDSLRRTAAYHAWRTAADDLDRAVALFTARELAGDPLQAEQTALALANRAKIEARLEALKANYPVEFIAIGVEGVANASGGSACVSFTHNLVRPRVARYDDFVEVSPSRPDLAVLATGRRLCVDGIAFGETVKLTLRQGLPGIGGRKLVAGASFDIAVPHRAASLRFRERGYVLPSHGPQFLPLESVNFETARVRVFRIVERNLIAAIEGEFPNQLRDWQVSNYASGDAEKVFDGTLTLGGEQNRTVTTGLAMSDLIGGPLEAGVYFIALGPAGGEETTDFVPIETSQWLVVSDIGLNLLQGPDGLHVFTRSLSSALPIEGVEVALVATSNRVLATARSDGKGHVLFDRPLVQGTAGAAPILVRAETPNLGFTFLPFSQASFDLSDRGIAGRDDPGPVDGFLFTERGVYRPGETVHASALLRDPTGAALSGLPLTLKLERPDGLEAARRLVTDKGAGGYAADLALALDSMLGQWTLTAHVDPEQPAISRVSFLVEDFVPPTIEVSATTADPFAGPGKPINLTVKADYLFGVPAADLRVDARAVLRTAEAPFADFAGYRFGVEEEPWSARMIPIGTTRTGTDGAAPMTASIALSPDTTHPLEAELTVSVFEVSGRAVSTTVVVPFRHQPVVLGVKPGFADGAVGAGAPAGFEVIAVGADGQALVAPGVTYAVYREDWDYIWFRRYDSWDYEVAVRDTPVARGTLDLKADASAPLSVDVEWGRYRLEVVDPKSGAATSLRFTAGWWVAPGSEGRPDMVNVRLDKQGYKVGDTAQVHVEPPYAGQLVLLRAGAKLDVVYSGPVGTEGINLPLPVDAAWVDGAGAYVLAAVYRPGEDLSVAMPARALGVAWLGANPARRDIKLALSTADRIRPNGPLAVTLNAPDGGRAAYAVVAAVDDAVLGLTGYETPDPLGYVMAQRRLAYEIRDTYGRLIDPRDAPRGVLRTGGDGVAQLDSSLAIRSTKVVSLYSGIVQFDAAGQATVSLDVPDFAGRLRVMAVAWSADRLGHAEADVTVRDPIVATLSLPRFLAPGDSAETSVSLQNVDAPAGDYQLSLKADGPIEVAAGSSGVVKLDAGGRGALPVTLRGAGHGAAKLGLVLEGPEGLRIERGYEITVRPTVNRARSSNFFAIPANQQYQVPAGLLDQMLPDTGTATLSLGASPDFGAGSHVLTLYDYAYRCLEQSSSRGVGLLWGLKWKPDAKPEIEGAIARVLALQRWDGAFGLWSSRADPEPWLSAYATEFLVRARAAGFEVPEVAYTNALAWLNNQIAKPGQAISDLSALSYDHYVLALAKQNDLGRLRHFATTNLEQLPGALDAALLGAALALYGENEMAVAAFSRALTSGMQPAPNDWFGTTTRELAAVLALLAEAGVLDEALPEGIDTLRAQVGPRDRFSTQESAWLVRTAAALAQRNVGEAQAKLGEEARSFTGTLVETLDGARLKGGLAVVNTGASTLFGTLDTVGIPSATPLPTEQGFAVVRRLLKTDGSEVTTGTLRQGDLVIVRLSGRSTDAGNHHALLVDLLPAGLEIENPQLGGDATLAEMPWLSDLSVVDYTAERDDRFVAALHFSGETTFEVAYLARAVTPGTFALPGPYVESMYRPDILGIGAAGSLTITR